MGENDKSSPNKKTKTPETRKKADKSKGLNAFGKSTGISRVVSVVQNIVMSTVQNFKIEKIQQDLMKRIKNVKTEDMQKILRSSFNNTKDFIIAMGDPIKRKEMTDKLGPLRPMKYPYTYTAKIAQFPLQHYVKNQWIWKYYFISLAVCVPVFYSINKLANSPGNVAKWAEIRRKEAAEHHH